MHQNPSFSGTRSIPRSLAKNDPGANASEKFLRIADKLLRFPIRRTGSDAMAKPLADRTTIVKLHGDIRTPERCLLSMNQYEQAYGNDTVDMTRPIPRLLEYYYKTSSLLFLGCSLNSDRTVQVFHSIKEDIGNRDIVIPQHFAIEQAPETEGALVARNAYLARLGITGIWFEKGLFQYVEDMLRLARNELRYQGVMPKGVQAAAV